jgi:outer membrane immunogenic protein
MKKILIATLAAVAMTGAASAADMSMPVKARPAPAPVYSWTGFYLNAGAGYGLWSADTTVIATATGAPLLPLTTAQGGKGYLGVLGGGYDIQLGGLGLGNWNPPVLIGIQADYDPSSIKGQIQDQGPFSVGNIKENYSWAVGARAGLIIFPEMLTYVNGGYTSSHFSGTTLNNNFAGGILGFTNAFTKNGWFLGGGTETTLSPLLPSGWFLRSEYRYDYYNTTNIAEFTPAGGPLLGAPGRTITFKPTEQTITTSVIYKFNWH